MIPPALANPAWLTEDLRKNFARKRIAYDELSLIAVLENKASPRAQVYYAVIGLRDVGTERCIPALKRMLHYPMRDVKDTSILTIAHIAGPAETEFYIAALLDKKTQKTYPMSAIYFAADERAVPAVVECISAIRKKFDPARASAHAYLLGVAYLAKFPHCDRGIAGILNDCASLWRSLSHMDRMYLRQAIAIDVERLGVVPPLTTRPSPDS